MFSSLLTGIFQILLHNTHTEFIFVALFGGGPQCHYVVAGLVSARMSQGPHDL